MCRRLLQNIPIVVVGTKMDLVRLMCCVPCAQSDGIRVGARTRGYPGYHQGACLEVGAPVLRDFCKE